MRVIFLRQLKTSTSCKGHLFVRYILVFLAIVLLIPAFLFLNTKLDIHSQNYEQILDTGRILFYSFLLICSSLFFLIFCILYYFRQTLSGILWFCAISYFFTLHNLGSFLYTLSSFRPFVYLERSGAFFVLFFVILFTCLVSEVDFTKGWRSRSALTLLFLCVPLCLDPIVSCHPNINVYEKYTVFLTAGKLFLALYLILCSIFALYRNVQHYFLLCADIIYGFSLILETVDPYFQAAVLPGRYEDFCCLLLLFFYCLDFFIFHYILHVKNDSLSLHLALLDINRTKQQISVSQVRKQMLTDAAHNLEAPLSAIQMYLDMILNEKISTDANLDQYLKIIMSKNSEMQKRVSEISSFLTLGESSSHKEPLLVSTLLNEFYHTYKPDADAAGLYFSLILPQRDVLIYGDQQRLQTVLENLFINALDFTPFEGNIVLSLSFNQSQVFISLEDSGYGIPPKILPHIFDFGFSGREELEQPRGIGLYFARIIIQEHGGEITATSSPDHGTTMLIQLPRMR